MGRGGSLGTPIIWNIRSIKLKKPAGPWALYKILPIDWTQGATIFGLLLPNLPPLDHNRRVITYGLNFGSNEQSMFYQVDTNVYWIKFW